MYKFFAFGFFLLTSLLLITSFVPKNSTQFSFPILIIYIALYIFFCLFILFRSFFKFTFHSRDYFSQLPITNLFIKNLLIPFLFFIVSLSVIILVLASGLIFIGRLFITTNPLFTIISKDSEKKINSLDMKLTSLEEKFHDENEQEFFSKNKKSYTTSDDLYTISLRNTSAFIENKENFGNSYPYGLSLCATSCDSIIDDDFMFSQQDTIVSLQAEHSFPFGPNTLPVFTVYVTTNTGIRSFLLYPQNTQKFTQYHFLASDTYADKTIYTLVKKDNSFVVNTHRNARTYTLMVASNGDIIAK